jgi:cobalamin biosynthesis Mg chelatase CobN
MRVEKDYRDFLRLLGAKKAKYLIVGGYAYSYHAEPRYTKDIDILVEATRENGTRVVAAIAEFWGMEPGVKAADFLRRDMIIQLGLAPVRIDIITKCAGIEFQSAWENRIKARYGDLDVLFISLEDLIKNKRAVGRDRDLLDAKYLERVKKAKRK